MKKFLQKALWGGALALVGLAASPQVHAVDYYLIGGFNNWSLAQANCKFSDQSDGTYVLDYNGTLTSGFKINDGTWSNDNANFGGSATLVLGQTYNLTVGGSSGNIPLSENIVNPHIVLNPSAKTLLITGQQQAAETIYGIHSDWFNTAWSTTNLTESNGKWVLAKQSIPAGTFGIRAMDKASGSQTAWIAASGTSIITPNTVISCKVDGTNFSNPAGEFEVIFDPEAMTIAFNGTQTGADAKPDYSSWYVNIVGDFNSWQDNGQQPNTDNIATLTNLAIGTKGFKVKVWNGSDNWYVSSAPVATGQWVQLNSQEGDDPATQIAGATDDSVYSAQYNVETNQIYFTLTSGGQVDPEPEPGGPQETDVTFDFNSYENLQSYVPGITPLDSWTADGSNKYYSANPLIISNDNITIKGETNGSATPVRLYSYSGKFDLRIAADNLVTFTAPNGYYFESITFNASATTSSTYNKLTLVDGQPGTLEAVNVAPKGMLWTAPEEGKVSSVVFSATGNSRFETINIKLTEDESEPTPEVATLYILGDNINGEASWDANEAQKMTYNADDQTYTWNGSELGIKFKFNNGSWNDGYNIGAEANGAYITLGQPLTVVNSSNSENIFIEENTYIENPTVVLNIKDMTVTVTGTSVSTAPYVPGDEVYLMGIGGDWTNGIAMNKNNEGLYVVTTEIAAPTDNDYVELKIKADDSHWYGPVDGQYDVTLTSGEATVLDLNANSGMANWNLKDWEGGEITFTLNWDAQTLSLLWTKEEVVPNEITFDFQGDVPSDINDALTIIDQAALIASEGESNGVVDITSNPFNYEFVDMGGQAMLQIDHKDGYSIELTADKTAEGLQIQGGEGNYTIQAMADVLNGTTFTITITEIVEPNEITFDFKGDVPEDINDALTIIDQAALIASEGESTGVVDITTNPFKYEFVEIGGQAMLQIDHKEGYSIELTADKTAEEGLQIQGGEGNYTIQAMADVLNGTTFTITITEDVVIEPGDLNVYISGAFNGYAPEDAEEWKLTQDEDNEYLFSRYFQIPEGQFSFNFVYGQMNLVPAVESDDDIVAAEESVNVDFTNSVYESYLTAGSSNIYWTNENWEGGQVGILLDLENQTITLQVEGETINRWFISGEFNGYNPSNDMSWELMPSIEPDENGIYSATFEIPANEFKFQLLDQNGNIWVPIDEEYLGVTENVVFNDDNTFTGLLNYAYDETEYDCYWVNDAWEGGKIKVSVDLNEGKIIIEDLNESDAISRIQARYSDDDVIYTLQGVRINRNMLNQGIYIINGKKVAVK